MRSSVIVAAGVLCLLLGCRGTAPVPPKPVQGPPPLPAFKLMLQPRAEVNPSLVIVTNKNTLDLAWEVTEPMTVRYDPTLKHLMYLHTGLQSCTNLKSPTWIAATNIPLPLAVSNRVTVPIVGPQKFFRAVNWDQ